jgi:uncharacterized protein
MNDLWKPDRRTFMRRGAMGAGAVWALSLGELSARAGHRGPVASNGVSPYGPIGPVADQTTGLPLLKLPGGFKYWSYSWTGDPMSDGVACPNLHDGMAVVDAYRSDRDKDDYGDEDWDKWSKHGDPRRKGPDRLVLVRNHEGAGGAPYIGNRPDITYAPEGKPTGSGGTTNLIFDPIEGKWLSSYASLAGTVRNCAGGVTPWGSWLTCEETGDDGHGWTFDVGPEGGDTTPLVDMGRFSHEANMVDPHTGHVYQTEDSGDCGLYKFVPWRKGRLERGGRLYMLTIRKQPNIDLGQAWPIGTTWDVRWVRIDDPTAATESCYAQGAAKGGARFSRLEGAWWGERTGFFLSTQWRQRRRGAGVRVQPVGRDAPCHLRRAELDRPRQPRQHHRDAAGRVAPLRGRRRQPVHRGRATGRSDAARPDVHVRDEQHGPDLELQRRGSRRRLSSERMGGGVLQPRRPLALREHPDAWRDVRDHRALGQGTALRRAHGLQ